MPKAIGGRAVIARHPKPPCGHSRLAECPLTVHDWEVVFFAYLGFLQTCRLVAEAAHDRENEQISG